MSDSKSDGDGGDEDQPSTAEPRKELKLASQLVMTPQLQMAIRLLAVPSAELPAMLDQYRSSQSPPIELTAIAPDEIDPMDAEEDAREVDELDDVPKWYPLREPPLPMMTRPCDVWVFGNPPQVRANALSYPRYRWTTKDGAWIARALRQRVKTYERVVHAVVERRPQVAVTMEPDKVDPVPIREIAEAIGMHESTITRVAGAVVFHTIHGLLGLVPKKSKLGFRGL